MSQVTVSNALANVKFGVRGDLAPCTDHFRVTTLPEPEVIREVVTRIDDLLSQYAE